MSTYSGIAGQLRVAALSVNRALDQGLVRLGITARQLQVLQALDKHPLTREQIGRLTGIDHSTINYMMRRMIKDGLVKATPTGGREDINNITAKGRAKVKAGSVIADKVEKTLASYVRPTDQAMLDQIIAEFKEDDDEND